MEILLGLLIFIAWAFLDLLWLAFKIIGVVILSLVACKVLVVWLKPKKQ